MTFFLLLIALMPVAESKDPGAMLGRYVVDERWVDYDAWRASPEDRATLQAWIDAMAAVDLFKLERDAQIAMWINLYNALTLDLVLDAGPVESIKDLGGPVTSTWERKIVTVAGRELSLDDIEHDILRVEFDEPRIHFALNCAAVSCPPLSATPFHADNLDEQLDLLTRRALGSPEWLDISGCPGAYGSGTIRLTRLFDWFSDDFGGEAGVRAFLEHYRPDLRFRLRNTGCSLEFMDYDWSLNAPQEP